MAKKVNDKQLKMPDILGLELDIAGDILNDNDIKYEIQDKKIITFFRDKNCVAKTIPKKNTLINTKDIVKVYPSKGKIGPLLIILLILIGVFGYMIKTRTITPFLFGAPYIEQASDNWNKSNIVYVSEDAHINNTKIDYYKYCISRSKSSSTCDFKDTYTKNIEISESGIWFVWFKGVGENGEESSLSNRLKVTIDNESPIITTIDKTISTRSIEVKVDAKDSLSGINKYLYSIDNQEFIESNKSYTFTSLEENKNYSIRVRVIDKANNYTDAYLTLSTSSTNKNKEETTTTINRIVPQISMLSIKSVITEGDKYNLPTSVTPSKYQDNTKCYYDDKEITNTSDLTVGDYNLKCVSTIDTLSVVSYKDIKVKVEDGDDEVFGDYVRLNLSYPKDATKYMYRFNTDDIRLDDEDWKFYTGPLYIPKNMVDKVITKYELNGEHIVSEDNLFIDIRPDKYVLSDNEETWININHFNAEDEIYYSVNGSSYNRYTDSFKVKGNTTIKAYIKKINKVYDETTNTIKEEERIKYDAVYIEKIYSNVGDKNNTDVSISLEDLPNTLATNKTYSIPSSYSYGIHGINSLVCTYDNHVINNTSDLKPGEYNIICSITALDGETKITSKYVRVEKDNYRYDLDNIPSIIKVGTNIELDKTCNVSNTSELNIGKNTIKCNNISKDIEVVKDISTYIDLNNIPDKIVVGNLYSLPSHYYGNNIKYIKCLDENNNLIYNTSTLPIGKHTLICVIQDENNKKMVSKKIEVLKPKYIIDKNK